MPWDQIWKAFMDMGGIHPALFLLAVGFAIYLGKELRSSENTRLAEHKQCSVEANTVFERRIEEQRATLQIMDRNVVNMAARTAAIDSTVVAMNELTRGFAELAIKVTALLSTLERLERKVDDIKIPKS